jgi:hypothetical protein
MVELYLNSALRLNGLLCNYFYLIHIINHYVPHSEISLNSHVILLGTKRMSCRKKRERRKKIKGNKELYEELVTCFLLIRNELH